ncbi:phosphopantetheine-binding protein [Oligoflexia bacterium]|nr:phosphopantetheine-binding protein [Oligoflexia bacterium]
MTRYDGELEGLSIADVITEILCKELGLEKKEIAPEDVLMEYTEMDSLTKVEVLMEVEDAFGLSIPDEDAEGIKTVGELVSYVERNIAS